MNKTFFVKNTYDDPAVDAAFVYVLLCTLLLFCVSRQVLSFVLAEIIYIIVSVLIYLYYEADKKVGFYINGSEMYFQGLTKRKYININEIAGIKITPAIKYTSYGEHPQKTLGGKYYLEIILLKEVTNEMWDYVGDFFYERLKPKCVGIMNYDKEVLDHLCSIKPDIKVIPWFTYEK